jgi:hypothetical protein
MWWLRAIIITSATSCALKERNKERECNRLDTAIVIVVVNKCRRKLLRSSSNPTLVVGETIEGKKEKKTRPKNSQCTRNYMLYSLQLSRLGILLFNVVTTTLYKIIWRFAQRSVSQDSKPNNWNLYIPFCLIFCGPSWRKNKNSADGYSAREAGWMLFVDILIQERVYIIMTDKTLDVLLSSPIVPFVSLNCVLSWRPLIPHSHFVSNPRLKSTKKVHPPPSGGWYRVSTLTVLVPRDLEDVL